MFALLVDKILYFLGIIPPPKLNKINLMDIEIPIDCHKTRADPVGNVKDFITGELHYEI